MGNSKQKGGVIDLEILSRLKELGEETGDADFLREMIALFVKDSFKTLERLERAVREDRLESVVKEAHHLKSGSANMGAHVLADCCQELENLGRFTEGDALALKRARKRFANLQRQYDRAIVAFKRIGSSSRGDRNAA